MPACTCDTCAQYALSHCTCFGPGDECAVCRTHRTAGTHERVPTEPPPRPLAERVLALMRPGERYPFHMLYARLPQAPRSTLGKVLRDLALAGIVTRTGRQCHWTYALNEEG